MAPWGAGPSDLRQPLELLTGSHSPLSQHNADCIAHRVGGKVQLLGDLFIGEILLKVSKDLLFPGSKGRGPSPLGLLPCTEKVGDLDTEVFKEFFAAMADNLRAAVHIENLYGDNSHHIAESCFKAFARALRHAAETDPRAAEILPSTKGTL